MNKKIKKVCSKCGSTELKWDAWAIWNEDKQDFDLYNCFDYVWCDGCESEVDEINEIEIKDETKEEF